MVVFNILQVLVLAYVVKLSVLQLEPFYSSCQEMSAVGTIRVSIYEADTQFLIDASTNKYSDGLRLAAESSSIGLQFDTKASDPISPNEYFDLQSGPRRDGASGREWLIQLKKPIDRDGTRADALDDQNVFEFTLQCRDLTSNTAFFILLRVQIIDVNDNPPVFVNTPYSVDVNELIPIGTTIFRGISTTDLDYDVNKNAEYDIVPGPGGLLDGSDIFVIDIPSQGFVTVNRTLDFETLNAAGKTTYVLQIRARDKAQPPESPQTSVTTLNITITDADDLGPVFEYPSCVSDKYGKCFNPSYTASILPEVNAGALTVFPLPRTSPATSVTIQACDQDTLNNPIRFSVETTDPVGYESYFTVTTSPTSTSRYTAMLSQNRPLGQDELRYLKVILRAEEVSENRRYERAIVYVTMINSTYESTTDTMAPCTTQDVLSSTASQVSGSDDVNVPAIALGCVALFLLVVVVLLVAYILRLRKQEKKDLYSHLSLNRASSAKYDVIKGNQDKQTAPEKSGTVNNGSNLPDDEKKADLSSVHYEVPKNEDRVYVEIVG